MEQLRQHAPKLLDQMREVMRVRHYARATEEAYVDWVKRYILFHNKRHPAAMGAQEVSRFLTHLAVEGHVAASTQNQALNAIVFRYKQVLEIELGRLDHLRSTRPARLPVVLSRGEVKALLDQIEGMKGLFRLIVELLYGTGMRLMEGGRRGVGGHGRRALGVRTNANRPGDVNDDGFPSFMALADSGASLASVKCPQSSENRRRR
jgi:site-specific recombinase XerD